VSVLAGQALPDGTNAVVPLERAEPLGSFVEVSTSLAVGDGVIPAATEFTTGAPLIRAGQVLRPQDLGLAALAGLTDVEVRARPRVVLALARAREHDPNRQMLSALVARDGGELVGIAEATDAVALEDFLRDTVADLLLVAGGSGFGDNDHAVDALAACGRVRLDGVAMHPGETLALGEVGDTPVGVLPGAPLGCLFAYDAVIARVLRRRAGLSGDWPYHRRACALGRKVASTLGRMEFCRVRVDAERAEPIATADGHLLRTAGQADGFIVIPPESEGHAEGSTVEVMMYGTTGCRVAREQE
jgi:molybdopterin molybdotransferase